MLNFFTVWNRLFFKPRLNIFDVVYIVAIAQLCDLYGWWVLPLIIPFTIASVYFENRFSSP